MFSLDRAIISPVLVGRAREVALLEAALRTVQQNTVQQNTVQQNTVQQNTVQQNTVQQGRGQLLLLAGEAGVGKSRLAAELRRQAGLSHWAILAGHCFERDTLFPYAPIVDALRALIGPLPAAVVADLCDLSAVELVKLLPELALIITDLHPTPVLDPEAEKRRLFEALFRFLIRLTQSPRAAPLLLIVEDLHWCDETTLDFLHLLARRLPTLPILLLATYRSEEAAPTLHRWLVQLDRARLSRTIMLEALPPQDVQLMLRAIFALREPVRAEFLAPIYNLTEGNPFFIEEVLKALVAAGEVFYAEDGWTRKSMPELHIPPSVQDAVQRRTAQLRPEAHRLLTLAAVVGRRFDFDLLQQVAGYAETELLALIKELVAAQLVVEESADHAMGARNHHFAFRHALTRQAVYRALLGRERQILHRTIGAAIEQSYGGAHAAVTSAGALAQVADLAYHFYEAGDWQKALTYGWQAGAMAQTLYAPRAALEQFTRALTAAQRLSQVEPKPPARTALYRLRGLAYETVGEFEHAHSDLTTALELAQAATDRLGEWQLLLDLGQLWAAHNYAQTGDYLQQALVLARTRDTQQGAVAHQPAPLAHTLNRLGNWYLNVGQPQEALRCHQEALAIFQELHNVPGLAQTFDHLGLMVYLGGNPVQGAIYLRQAIAHFQTLQERQSLASSLTTLAICGPGYSTDSVVPAALSVAEAAGSIAQALEITEAIGWRAGAAYTLVSAGNILGTVGQYNRAFDHIRRGLAVAEEIEHHQWICFAQRTLGILYRDLLALPLARQHLEQSITLARAIGSLFHVRQGTAYLASLLLASHEVAEAETLLNNVFDPALPCEALAPRRIWLARAELALAQGDPTLALQIVDRLLAATANVEGHERGAVPYLAKLRGEALVALRQWPEAEHEFQSALLTAQAQGTPRFVWPLQLALGKLYRAQRRHAEATQAFDAARTVIGEIAVTLDDRALRDNFVQHATALTPAPRPLSARQAAKAAYGGLTRREREVAALIAQGHSNRAIAATLILGERTVEGYVANIMARLGFSARSQIAAWVVESGLGKDDGMTG
ncbi:MAG: AAA family ATPase [Caldilineaceae bacterium]